MHDLDENTITQAVIARLSNTPDARLKEVLTSLVQHLHSFACEVRPTEEELMQGLAFFKAVGQQCDERRQEFILLSNAVSLSMLTVAMNQAIPSITSRWDHRITRCLPTKCNNA